jgi:hypothetical protein
MEISQVAAKLSEGTPKRSRDEDLISPESVQKNKEVKMGEMAINNDQFNVIMERLKLLDPIQASLDDIKRENAEFRQSLGNIEERVRKVEEKVEAINEVDVEALSELKTRIKSLESQNNHLLQKGLNNNLTLRNLPKEIQGNQEKVSQVIENLFKELQIIVRPDEFEAYGAGARGKNQAVINMTFATSKLKKDIIKKIRKLKNDKAAPHLLVEKLTQLPIDHPLNGKKLTATNHLTAYNLNLLEYARKFVPSHFEYAFDNDDGLIKVKTGQGLKKVTSTDDVDKLVSNAESEKSKLPPKSAKKTVPSTDRVTRFGSTSSANLK